MTPSYIERWLVEIGSSVQCKNAGQLALLMFGDDSFNGVSSFVRRVYMVDSSELKSRLSQCLPRELILFSQKYVDFLIVYSTQAMQVGILEILYSMLNEILNPGNLSEWWFLPLFRAFVRNASSEIMKLRGASGEMSSNYYGQATLFLNRFHRKLSSTTLQILFGRYITAELHL